MKKQKLKKEIIDFIGMISMVLGLLSLSMFIVYYIVQNYVDVDSIFGGAIGKKKVYILKSVNNEKYIPYLKKYLKKDYAVIPIKLNVLLKQKKGLLFLINAQKLDENQINGIANFVKNGGSIIFNYANKKLVQYITGLKRKDILAKGKYEAQTPLLSTFKIDKTKINLYDSIFLYDKEAILDFTKDYKSYGVMWEGNYGEGNWIYYSFPFYVFQENNLKITKKRFQPENSKTIYLLKDMIDFAYYGYKVVKFPFVDIDKMVVIDEYMDYKYDDSLIKYIQKNNLKATIFINPNIIKHKIDVNDNNIEIASMSDKDKWKLAKYTKQTIVGYSNESDINPNVDKLYHKYGFKYMFNTVPSNGIYYDDFVVLAHNGFNDISLNDNIEEIEKNIQFYSKYRIYSFTLHSYILGNKKNFSKIKSLLNKLKKYPLFTAKEIAQKYNDTNRISMSAMLTPASLAIRITNDTLKDMKNVTFRVYSKYKFERIESNFFNIKTYIIKETPEYIDVKVEKMSKNIEFYLRFKQ